MAIVSPAQITVTTTETLVLLSRNGHDGTPQALTMVAPAANTADVLVGGTADLNAFPIPAGASLSIDLYAGDAIYAKVATGTQKLSVIYNRS